jgi:hypothetical protein
MLSLQVMWQLGYLTLLAAMCGMGKYMGVAPQI